MNRCDPCLAHSRHSKNILWNNTEKKIMVRTFQGGPRDFKVKCQKEENKCHTFIYIYIYMYIYIYICNLEK